MKKIFITTLILLIGFMTFAQESAIFSLEDYAKNFNSILGELHSYKDYKSVLNKDTVEANTLILEMFDEDFEFMLNEQNLYCEEIHLKGINSKTIALMQLEGSLQLPYLTIFVYDSALQKYKVFYDCFVQSNLPFVIPVETDSGTLFVEQSLDFDTKRITDYRLLEFAKNEWNILASLSANYKYNLSQKDKKWINEERIEQLSRFDYSFAGIQDDHPAEVKFTCAQKNITGKLYHTSVARQPSSFTLKIFDGEKEIKTIGGFVWGFYTVHKGKKEYLVYIGSGSEKGEDVYVTIESFYFKVIDLDSMKCVYKNLINPEITYSISNDTGCW